MSRTAPNDSDNLLATRFARLSTTEQPAVDVFDFLKHYPDAGLDDVAAVCAVDQSLRWKHGQGPPVEEYLERIPQFGSSPRHSLQLVISEFRLRTESGDTPQLGEFVQRFPQFRLDLLKEFSGDNPAGPTASIEMPGVAEPEPAAEPSDELLLSDPLSEALTPEKIGKYRIQRILGDGGFGRVYLATDEVLRRSVALKVPHAFRVSSRNDVEAYLEEARILARLDHPAIVPVYDSDRSDSHRCYTVTKYVEGSDLAVRNRRAHLSFTAAAELISKLADALQYSHEQGVFHRDIKPANILIDLQDRPYISDFGIALKEEDWGKEQATAGTPAYMSPEQLRGEGHLVDGRSDIFSLGVVLYELLCGRRPFARTVRERLEQTEARPLRQMDDSVPAELERICSRAMAHRVTERYNTAQEMAEDLRHFIRQGTTTGPSARNQIRLSSDGMRPTSAVLSSPDALTIVPKGLRSFGLADAAFFPELLQGPRDRHGLPESVAFWKERVTDRDPQTAFRVGLLYGPSGCGKSSFLKAAVLPQLPPGIISAYVEATPHETELRLLRTLRQHCPQARRDLGLAETMALLRRERVLPAGGKLLIVLDQFEQWLHGRPRRESDELIRALRQCDGIHVQCIITVRDDFWMAITHFMEELEVSLIPDRNVAVIDLFSQRHARKVLTAMGRAYGALPEGQIQLNRQQRQFVHRAVEELSSRDQVIPVHLSLFAEMVSKKQWVPSTLQELGGVEGLGVTFLEETFNGRGANPGHRLHQKGARAVLATLLEEHNSGIKGGMKSLTEMRLESGYEHRPHDFETLLQILDSQLRLITPTDPEGLNTVELEADSVQPPDERYYHLTHDYLVPSLTEWLSRKKKETLRGRAELLLEERSRTWQARPSSRTLPSFAEWLRILILMPRRKRAHLQTEQQMMRAATRYYLKTTSIIAVALLGIGWWWTREATRQARARGLVESVAAAAPPDVPSIIDEIDQYRRWADPLLIDALEQARPESRAGINLRLARLPVDPGSSEVLMQQLLNQNPETLNLITDELLEHVDPSEIAAHLWTLLPNENESPARRFRAAAALARFHAQDSESDPEWIASSDFLADELIRAIAENRSHATLWTDDFKPISQHLSEPLMEIFSDAERADTDRNIAALLLHDYVADQPEQLVELLITATPQQHHILMPGAEVISPEISRLARRIYDTPPTEDLKFQNRSTVIQRQAYAAVLMFALGTEDAVWSALSQTKAPGLMAHTEHRLSTLALHPRQLYQQLRNTASAPQRAALLRILGAFSKEDQRQISESVRERFIAEFTDCFHNDPASGVHGAAEFALRRWNQTMTLEPRAAGDRQWYINGQGQTMVIIKGPVQCLLGSPDGEPGKGSDEAQHDVRIPRTFSVSATEVTQAQYRQFDPDDRWLLHPRGPQDDCPALAINWIKGVKYCQWLCEQEGIPPDQWCYPKDIVIEYGMELPENYLNRTGYRLPTDAEWEYTCRGNTTTLYSFGHSIQLLPAYAWYQDNSNGRSWPVAMKKPSQRGLFDIHGNVMELCHDRWANYPSKGTHVDSGDVRPLRDEWLNVARGGSYAGMWDEVRSANRRGNKPDALATSTGFRIARTISVHDD